MTTYPPGVRARFFLKRFVAVGLSSLLTVTAMLGFFAWLSLQIDWRIPDPAAVSAPSVLLDRHGGVLARFTSEVDFREVPLGAVSPVARDAIIASEDARFYEHGGVDPASLVRAVFRNIVTGSIEQGGSTLTQQYVKNAFVGSERTILRKVREAVISIQLERDLTKDEILERYLNAVYFGEGAYGIEAASLTYWGKRAADLSAAEGATLAQLLPAPSVRNPRVDPDGARERRNRVLDRMLELGLVTPDEHAAAIAAPIEVLPRTRNDFPAPFFVEYVRKQLETAYGRQAVLTGGLRVTTTLDPDAQAALEQAVATQLPKQEGEFADVDAGAVAIHPGTGEILALYGGRDFENFQFDLATQARRQAGSTFKPLVFMAALEQDYEPTTPIPAPAKATITDCGDDIWEPENAGGSAYGTLPMREGLIRSVNTVFARVGCDVGPDNVVDVGARLGIKVPIEPVRTVALGAPPLGPTVLDMASVYASIANDGRYCRPRSFTDVVGPDGTPREVPVEMVQVPGLDPRPRAAEEEMLAGRPEELVERDDDCVAVAQPDVVRETTLALEEVVKRTTGRRADIGRPQAGKTGTTNEEKDAWFAGYTPDLSLVVWVGDADYDQDGVKPMRDIEGFSRVQGGTIPALIWHDAASEMLRNVAPSSFLRPGEGDPRSGRAPGPRVTPSPSPEPSPEPSPSPTSTTPTEEPSPSPSPTDPGPPEPPPISPPPQPSESPCVPILQECPEDTPAPPGPP